MTKKMNKYQKEIVETTLQETKNEIMDSMSEHVTLESKKIFLTWLRDKIIPIAKDIGNAYSEAIKDSTKDKNGWVKFRDNMLIPGLISVSLWAIDSIIEKAISLEE